MADDNSPRSVAVYVDLDLVGDALMKLPMVRALRRAWPAAEITWIAGVGRSAYGGTLAPLVQGLIDRVLENAGFGEQLCAALGPPPDVLIGTQSRLSKARALRRLRPRRFVALAARGLASSPPVCVLREERHLARRLLALVERATGRPADTSVPLALPPAALAIALAARCADAVAADCGGDHMIAAAGTPLVSLFGPTDPEKFAPSADHPRIIRAQDFGGETMDAIPVAAVLAALVK